ncbi:hypothetical protein CEXT_628011 [Caerostris extrusa]|uniref:Uncharacterized protein n=1 Tax=Caerostris extrusa TaxID=172846 RepID=A0AAV4WGQ6_CAEEX|nr:hypothetical protein CEXT_628011 [Caerostris extrusa]
MSLAASPPSSLSRCDILTEEDGIPMRPANSKKQKRYAAHSLERRIAFVNVSTLRRNEIETSLRLRLGQTSFRDESEGGGGRTLKMSLAASLPSQSRCDILTRENGILMRPGESRSHLLAFLFDLQLAYCSAVVVSICCEAKI